MREVDRVDGVLYDSWRFSPEGYAKARQQGLRFGQAFLNEFFPHTHDSEVFYGSFEYVRDLIERKYIRR